MSLIIERIGYPPKSLNLIIKLHDNKCSQIRYNSELSELILITNGVKHGCILAPTIIAVFFSFILKQVTNDLDNVDGVYIRCRLDDNLFNIQRLQAYTKTLERLILDLPTMLPTQELRSESLHRGRSALWATK